MSKHLTILLDLDIPIGIVNSMSIKKLLGCASIKNARYRRIASYFAFDYLRPSNIDED